MYSNNLGNAILSIIESEEF